MLKRLFLITMFTLSQITSGMAGAQTYIQGKGLIETPTLIATAGGTTTLTATSNTVLNFTGTLAQTVQLPAANTLPLGRYFVIWNSSTQAVTVNDGGAGLVKVVPSGSQIKFVVKNVGSVSGVWLSESYTASQISNTPSGSVASTTVQAAVNEVSGDVDVLTLKLAQSTSTGVKDGLNLSVDTDPTKFDIAAGQYEIVDLTDINNPIVTTVNYAGSNANVVTNLATHDVTYISLDSSGAIHQATSFPDSAGRRDRAFVGRLNHVSRTSISFADTFPDFKLSPVASFYDLVDALAPFRLKDFTITPNGANLSFNRDAGSVFFRSANYTINKKNPHILTYNSQTLQPFRKMTQTTTTDVADVTVLDPANYDVAGTVTAIGGASGRSSVQRVYLYKSGAVRVAYGQTVYGSFSDAVAGINSESFVLNPTVEQTAVLLALVVLRRNCTSLQDTTCAKIVPVNRFGGLGGGAGGGAGSDLQGAYDASTQPQIVLNSTLLGIQVRDNATPITGNLWSVQDSAGTTDYLGVSQSGGSGLLGVNITLPQGQLHVHRSGVNDSSMYLTNGFTGSTATDGAKMSMSSTGVLSLYNQENNTLIFGTNNSARMTLSATGLVAIGSSAPSASSKLDIQGTDGALLLPRLTTAQVNALTPANGMVVYDTDIGRIRCYAGGAWGDCSRESINTNSSLTGSGTIAISLTLPRQTWLVAGSASGVTVLAASPFGASAPVDGAEITLIGTSATNMVSLPFSDAAKGVIPSNVVLGRGDVVVVKYMSSLDRYVVKSVNN